MKLGFHRTQNSYTYKIDMVLTNHSTTTHSQ